MQAAWLGRTIGADGRSSRQILCNSRASPRRPFALSEAVFSCGAVEADDSGASPDRPSPELVAAPDQDGEHGQRREVEDAERGGSEQRLQWWQVDDARGKRDLECDPPQQHPV